MTAENRKIADKIISTDWTGKKGGLVILRDDVADALDEKDKEIEMLKQIILTLDLDKKYFTDIKTAALQHHDPHKFILEKFFPT